MHRRARAHRGVETIDRAAQHLAVQEDQRRARLVLRRCGDLSPHRQIRQERDDVSRTQIVRMRQIMKVDEAAHPTDIGLLGPNTEVPQPARRPQSIEQTRRCKASSSSRASVSTSSTTRSIVIVVHRTHRAATALRGRLGVDERT